MSHISSIEVKITDLDAFEAACRECGVELRRQQRTFRNFGGRQSPCEMAVVLPGNRDAYELGLVKTADGKGYSIQMDNWQQGFGMNAKVGNDACTLRQMYGVHAATAAARKQGMTINRQQLPDGSIRLVCEPRVQYAQAGMGIGSGF